MPRLIVFNHLSLDGYFTDEKNDMSWAHQNQDDPEWKSFVEDNASGDATLVFGRVTYEMMVSYWPTPMAAKNDPTVAKHINNLPKVVFSRTLDKATWNNTRLVKDNLASEVRRMKEGHGSDVVIMGSGTLVSQLTQENLIDEYQFVMVPIVLGAGRSMFEGVQGKRPVKRTKTRTFDNGKVLLCYQSQA